MHYFFYEGLVNDHIRDLENEAAAWHERRARRAAKKAHGASLLSRIRRHTRHPGLVRTPSVRTFETTTSAT